MKLFAFMNLFCLFCKIKLSVCFPTEFFNRSCGYFQILTCLFIEQQNSIPTFHKNQNLIFVFSLFNDLFITKRLNSTVFFIWPLSKLNLLFVFCPKRIKGTLCNIHIHRYFCCHLFLTVKIFTNLQAVLASNIPLTSCLCSHLTSTTHPNR